MKTVFGALVVGMVLWLTACGKEPAGGTSSVGASAEFYMISQELKAKGARE